MGTTGDSYDNALAESIIGLYKTEVIRRRGPWRNVEAVEFATLEWVDWFNNRRLLEPIGNIPPAEFKQEYYCSHESHAMADSHPGVSGIAGAVHINIGCYLLEFVWDLTTVWMPFQVRCQGAEHRNMSNAVFVGD